MCVKTNEFFTSASTWWMIKTRQPLICMPIWRHLDTSSITTTTLHHPIPSLPFPTPPHLHITPSYSYPSPPQSRPYPYSLLISPYPSLPSSSRIHYRIWARIFSHSETTWANQSILRIDNEHLSKRTTIYGAKPTETFSLLWAMVIFFPSGKRERWVYCAFTKKLMLCER